MSTWVYGGVSIMVHIVYAGFWLALALIGLLRVPRRCPTPRLVLTTAGLSGALLSVLWPTVQTIATTVLLRQMGVDSYMKYQIGLLVFGSLLWLLPWALLLYGLLGLTREIRGSDGP